MISIEAAITEVPEGFDWLLRNADDGQFWVNVSSKEGVHTLRATVGGFTTPASPNEKICFIRTGSNAAETLAEAARAARLASQFGLTGPLGSGS